MARFLVGRSRPLCRRGHFGCSCPGWTYAGGRPEVRRACKHIREVLEWSCASCAASQGLWPAAGAIEAPAESAAANWA